MFNILLFTFAFFLSPCFVPSSYGLILPDVEIISESDAKSPQWKLNWDKARLYARNQEFVKAAKLYAVIFKDKPETQIIIWEYAQVLFEIGDIKESELLLEQLRYYDTHNIDYILLSGKVALKAGNYNKAIKFYNIVFHNNETKERLPEVLSGLIKSYQKLNDKKSALPLMESLYQTDESNNKLLKELCMDSLYLEDLEKAERFFNLYLEKFTTDDEVVYNAANLFQKIGDTEKTLSMWLKYLEIYPDYLPFVANVSDYFLATGEKKLALPYLLKILTNEPNNTHLLLKIARIYIYTEGRLDKALTLFDRYLVINPEDQEVLTEIKRIEKVFAADMLSIVEDKGAWVLWQDLASIIPDRLSVYKEMATLLEYLGRTKDLLNVLHIIHRHRYDDYDVIIKIAEIFINQERFGLADNYLSIIGEEGGKKIAKYHLLSALIAEENKNLLKALVSYEKYLDIVEDDFSKSIKVVTIAGELGLVETMVARYKRIIGSIGEKKDIYELDLVYAQQLINNHFYNEARKIYIKIIGDESIIEDNYMEIHLAIAETLYKEGLSFEAEQYLRKLVIDSEEKNIAIAKIIGHKLADDNFDMAKRWASLIRDNQANHFTHNDCEEEVKEILFAKAELMIADGDEEDAIESLWEFYKLNNQVCDLFDDSWGKEILHKIFTTHYINGDDEELEELILQYDRLYGNDWRLLLMRSINNRVNDDEVENDTKMTFLQLMNEANFLFDNEEFSEALELYRQASKLIPGSVKAKHGQVLSLSNEKKYGSALIIVEDLLSKYPHQQHFKHLSVKLKLKLKYYHEVIKELQDDKISNNLNITDRSNIRDIVYYARALWGGKYCEKALNTYNLTLEPTVESRFGQEIVAQGFKEISPVPKRTLWNIITFTNPTELNILKAALKPEFIVEGINYMVANTANKYFSLYEWQNKISDEMIGLQDVRYWECN